MYIGAVSHFNVDDVFLPGDQVHISIAEPEKQRIPFLDVKALMKVFLDFFGSRRSDAHEEDEEKKCQSSELFLGHRILLLGVILPLTRNLRKRAWKCSLGSVAQGQFN
jgi:hypothetical protein